MDLDAGTIFLCLSNLFIVVLHKNNFVISLTYKYLKNLILASELFLSVLSVHK